MTEKTNSAQKYNDDNLNSFVFMHMRQDKKWRETKVRSRFEDISAQLENKGRLIRQGLDLGGR